MTNSDLQAALIPLAPKDAAVHPDLLMTHNGETVRAYLDSNRNKHPLPGADGTLADAEVTTVLGWLTKAGYETTIDTGLFSGDIFVAIDRVKRVVGQGDTLHSALANAILKLPSDKIDEASGEAGSTTQTESEVPNESP